MTQTLKPCPFCGGKAERVDIEDGDNAGGSCIACTHCMASSNVEFEFKENFISNWNRRASEQPSIPLPEEPTEEMVESAAQFVSHRNTEGSTSWEDLEPHFKAEWRQRVRPVIAAALAAAPQPLGEDRWLPIKTAPMDGTPIQAIIPGHGRDNVISWQDGLLDSDGCDCGGWCFAEDQEPPDDWTDGICWQVNESGLTSTQPTHWRPLPPPPKGGV